MKDEKKSNYYVGLDIGTNSVGYAVTNMDYSMCKHKGNPMCGVTLFDEAEKCDKRRGYRSGRRRLDRRQQRVLLVQELFADEIAKVDSNFFVKIRESALFAEDKTVPLSNDEWYIKEYQKKYPTIHHLIYEIMMTDEKYDIRLIYLACAWLVAHRGHFLNDIDGESVEDLTDMTPVYAEFNQWFIDNGYAVPWECDINAIKNIISKTGRISDKEKEFYNLAFGGKKPADDADEYPFSKSAMVKLLCGGTVKAEKLFIADDFECVTGGSITLSKPDELEALIDGLGEAADLLIRMSKLYDCAVLSKILSGETSISNVKIKEYNQHKDDLKELKYIIKKYCKDQYDNFFRSDKGYSLYVSNFKSSSVKGSEKSNKEDFYKEVKAILGRINTDDAQDNILIANILAKIESGIYMPKQVNSDNRVIPQQLYYAELKKILENASKHYGFLTEKDESGISTSDKIKSVFKFKIPYFVGPLNANSQYAWLTKKSSDKIYPWNFERVIDFDKSESAFIERMTNQCSYLPGETVLPKNSILYTKYIVLNEINNIKIDSQPISVEVKQDIFNSLFMPNGRNKPKVTAKAIADWFVSKGYINKNETDRISGIDIEIKSSMKSYFDFYRLINNGTLSVDDAENIIEHSTYTESKLRMKKWLMNEYSLSKEDIEYLLRKQYKDFGRLSKTLLNGIEGTNKTTGEIGTVMYFMWNTNDNFMQIVADNDKYDFKEQIERINHEYYCQHPTSLHAKLDDMQISNGVKRPIFRTLEIMSDIVKVKKCPPKKIFIEMARGATDNQKNKRSKSRKDSLMEIYKSAKTDEAKRMIDELSKLGDDVDNKLKSERLYLYFAQLGKCMYCGKPIALDSLFTQDYDVDHIWPQAYVKDDSIHNNKVLVHKTENGTKGDKYPLPPEWQNEMHAIWQALHNIKLINNEKYKRLTRTTPFTAEEKSGFINRQIVETRQSTKAVASLLKDIYKETEVVYVKSMLTSEFRHKYGDIKNKAFNLNLSNEQKKQEELVKSRSINDIHHANDAYLNIVVGNVYNTRFSKRWFDIKDKYSLNYATLFGNPLKFATDVWEPTKHLPIIDNVMANQHIHLTKFQTEKKGGFFDQQPKGPGSDELIPLKKGMDTEKYGGYNKPAATFYVLVKYQKGKKSELSILPIDLLVASKFKSDEGFAKDWVQKKLGNKATNLELPLNNRVLKVNTVFSLDGFDVCLSGKANGGKILSFRSLETCYYSKKHIAYMKKIEKANEKLIMNPKYTVTEKHDGITAESNMEIFKYIAEKINSKFYEKLPGPSFKIDDNQMELFSKLPVDEQIKCVVNMALYLKTNRAGTCDMTTLDGKKGTGSIYLSANISNWKYSDIRIIDRSASGLYETKSINLKELL